MLPQNSSYSTVTIEWNKLSPDLQNIKNFDGGFKPSTCECSAAFKRNLGTTFSVKGLVYFPQDQQSFNYLYYFPLFHPLLFSCISCFCEQNTGKLIIYLRNLSEKPIFFFSSSFLGIFLWAPTQIELYHFQSGCNPSMSSSIISIFSEPSLPMRLWSRYNLSLSSSCLIEQTRSPRTTTVYFLGINR